MSRYVIAMMSSNVTETVYLRAGEVWAADDPLVVAHPEWFSADLELVARRTVPRAELPQVEPKRGPGRPRKIETADREQEYEIA